MPSPKKTAYSAGDILSKPIRNPMFPGGDYRYRENPNGSVSNVLLGTITPGRIKGGETYVLPNMAEGKEIKPLEPGGLVDTYGWRRFPKFPTLEAADAFARSNHGNIDEKGYLVNPVPFGYPLPQMSTRSVKRADPGLKTRVLPPLMPPKMAIPGLKEIVSREPVLAGNILSGPDTEFNLKIDSQGYVDKGLFRKFLGQELSGSQLKGFIPKDGKRYGITTGSVDEWADFFHKLAGKESSFRANQKGDVGLFPPALGRASTDSDGMFQLSPNDALTYRGAYGKHFQNAPYTQEQLVDPIFNTREAIKIMESLLGRSGNPRQGNRIVSDSMFGTYVDNYGKTRHTGPSAYWGPLRTWG